MNKSIHRLSIRLPTRHSLHRLRAPVTPDIGKPACLSCQKVTEQHRQSIQVIILCGEHHRLAPSMPVKGRIQYRFRKIRIGLIVRPHTLSLETAEQTVASKRLLLKSHPGQFIVAQHHISDNHGHLDHELPLSVFILSAVSSGIRIRILALPAVLPDPAQRICKLFLVIDPLIHTTQNFCHIHPFRTHAEILCIEGRIKKGTHNAHGYGTEAYIGFVLHLSYRNGTSGEPQDLLPYIRRNLRILHILYIPAVNRETWPSHLVMCRQSRGKIYGSRTLRSVESPDSLRCHRVHINCFQRITPAWCHA